MKIIIILCLSLLVHFHNGRLDQPCQPRQPRGDFTLNLARRLAPLLPA